MDRQRLAVAVVISAGVVLGQPAPPARAGSQGHTIVGGGFAGRGFYGRGFYGRGFYGRGYYGYPGWYGLGLGVGLGCAYAYGYPYYYPYGCPYSVYVDPYGPAPVAAYPPPGPGAVQGAVPASPDGPGPRIPVRLTESDVLLSVHVPSDATVWINGEKTTQSGPRREFLSSGLSPGRSYTFVLAAQWTEPDGRKLERRRRLSVQGGERRNIDFLAPPPPLEEGPAVIAP
jgi:uncharacterized protein (TIGR03000 family)